MTITQATNAPAGGSATITGTYTPAQNPAPTSIEYTVLSGPDTSTPNFHGTACTADTSGGYVCHVANGGTPGTDNVRVFGDTNGNNTWDTGEPLADHTVVFSGAPTHVTLTAPGTAGTTGTCSQWSANATDANSSPAAGQTLTLTVTETTATNPGANPITLYSADCSTVVNSGGTVTGTGPFTVTYTHSLTVGSDGTVGFGLSATTPGTATVSVAGGSGSDTKSFTWTAGGAGAVTTLTATPTSQTQYTGTTESFTVKATDGTNAIQGVTVFEKTTGATDPDQTAATSCGTTNASGNVTCSITNGGTAGTDHLVFWVNNCTTTCTAGPDTGEPQTTASAIFQQAPAVNAGHSSLTCVQQLAGANQGTAQTDCTVPTSQHGVTFTALVEDASGNPIPGAIVTFTATSATFGGVPVTGSSLPSGTGTTDAAGKATFTVTDSAPANNDSVTVNAKVGSTSIGTATAHWQAPHAAALTVTPPVQSVTNGGTVTVKATVTDQFGAAFTGSGQSIAYTVTGRNNGKSGTAAADGTITYTDTGTSGTSDTIHVTELPDGFTGTAVVNYITGSTTASTVTVDTSGNGTTDANCGATGHTAATNVALGSTTEVCALVKNSAGEVLAGKTVTFTVNNGQVAAHGGLTTASGKTYQATTDAAGVAFADVTSTTSGVQTVTATADSATGSGTITYTSPAATAAYSIALAPATATINPGSSQKFIATVTDKFGNPVAGVSVTFTQSGPGTIGGASSATVTTGADGTASATVSTTATDSGAGSLTATIATAGTQCASATTGTPPSKCTASSTYTVASTATPSSLTLSAATGVHAGGTETVFATAMNSDGTPAANQVVRFFVSGANSATGSATTNASGHASFSYTAVHSGTDSLAAYVDTNNDSIRESNEPRAFASAQIAANRRAEHPSIRLGTTALNRHHGTVTVFVATRPAARHALVRYFVKRNGVWHFIGANRTGGAGHAAKTFREPAHHHLRFRVKVSPTATTKGATSPWKAITVA